MDGKRAIFTAAAAAGVLAFSGAGEAAFVTDAPNTVRQQLDAFKATFETTPFPRAVRKAVDKALVALDKGAAADGSTLTNEVKTLAKVAKLVERKLADQTAVLDALRAPIIGYSQAVVDGYIALDLAIDAQGLSRKARKALEKRRKAALKALSKLPTKRAAGPLTLTSQYAALAAAATATAGFNPVDDGDAYIWALDGVAIAGPTTGFDLDGDGTVDNVIGQLATALAGLSFDANGAINAQIDTGTQVGLIQMWNVHSFDADTLVYAGFARGEDTDGDASDNFSGTETFTVAGLAQDGHPQIRTVTALTTGGAFRLDLDAAQIEVIGQPLPANVHVRIDGNASPQNVTGVIGGPIPIQTVIDFLTDKGLPLPGLALAAVTALADLDLDGDGQKDAFSAAFQFTAVPAFDASQP